MTGSGIVGFIKYAVRDPGQIKVDRSGGTDVSHIAGEIRKKRLKVIRRLNEDCGFVRQLKA